MDYEHITIKELTARAEINRKTFYLHYPSLDALLGEVQDEVMEGFTERTKGFDHLRDIDKITREFFLYAEQLGPLGQRINYNGYTRYTKNKIGSALDSYAENIITAFVSSSTVAMYRQWVVDGRKIPIEKIIKITSQLICHGVSSLRN
jgi:AcrR family transcriptional regulator